VKLRRFRAGIEQEQDAPLLLPKFTQQLHLPIGEIVLRAVDQDGFQFGRDRPDLEEIQFLELDVFALDECLQHLDGAGGRLCRRLHRHGRRGLRDRGLLVAEHVTDRVLFAFDQLHQSAGHGLLAFERRDLGRLPEHGIPGIDLGHVGCFDRFVAALVIENEQFLTGDDFVFVEHRLGPGETALGIDVLNIQLPFRGVLKLGQHSLDVGGDGAGGEKQHRDSGLARHAFEETFRFIGEGELLVSRLVPAPVMLEPEIVHHHSEEEQKGHLHQHVHPDADTVDLWRLRGFPFGIGIAIHLIFCGHGLSRMKHGWAETVGRLYQAPGSPGRLLPQPPCKSLLSVFHPCSSVAEEILKSPLPGLERLMGQHQHHDCHADIQDHRPRIDQAAGERPHLFNGREVAE
jgi:hypothetical protein